VSGGLHETLEAAFARCRDLDAPLGARLQAYAGEVRRVAPQFAATIDALVGRLAASNAGAAAPAPGEPMPDFLLPDEQGRLTGMHDLIARGPVAIAFHRGHWCPYCRMNIAALAGAAAQLEGEGRGIVAITPDRQKFAASLKAGAKAPFPVLTDIDSGYAMSLGLAIWVGAEMAALMAKAGRNPAASQGTADWLLPIPATFIVGSDGIVTARFIDPDYRVRMAIEDVVAALRAAR
jgi:peroxiredoxin